MNTDANTAIVLQFYRAFDDRQLERAMELLTADFVAHLAGMPNPLNREAFKQFGLSFYTAFRGGHHQFEQVIAVGDKVITQGHFTASHQGAFQGLPPTGKPIQLAIMHIDRLQNGQIVEHWGQGDTLGLMQQLGMIFLPGPALLPALIKSLRARLFKP